MAISHPKVLLSFLVIQKTEVLGRGEKGTPGPRSHTDQSLPGPLNCSRASWHECVEATIAEDALGRGRPRFAPLSLSPPLLISLLYPSPAPHSAPHRSPPHCLVVETLDRVCICEPL